MNLAQHLQLVEQCNAVQTLTAALETLKGIPFTVVGGWSVFAHGGQVPSVDLDIWIDLENHNQVYERFLEVHDVQLDTSEGLGRFNLNIEYTDSPNQMFGTNRAFIRGELHTQKMPLFGHQVETLTGPDLLFAKAKAFHDRSQQWALSQDPVALAALATRSSDEASFIQNRGTDYWLRKAGKDLLDIQFLQSKYEIGGPLELRPLVEARLQQPHPTLTAWGTT